MEGVALKLMYIKVTAYSTEYRMQNTETHVHKIIYGALIDTALYLMLFMRAKPLLGQVGWCWALEISTFWGPKWHSPNGSMLFHRAQKVSISRAQPPSHLP